MSSPVPQPSRAKRIVRVLLFLFAGFITLIALLLAEENWRGARAWREFQRESEAKGDRFDIARLLPPKVPDDQNFMMTPFLAPLYDLPPAELAAPITFRTNIIDGQEVVQTLGITNKGTNLGSFYPDVKGLHRPPATWSITQDSDLLAIARACLTSNSAVRPDQILDARQAAVVILDHLQPCAATLEDLRQATARPYSQAVYPWEQWNNPRVTTAVFWQFGCLKGLDAVVNLDASCSLALGNSDRALQDIHVMFRLDEGLRSEPLLIADLVRMAGMAIAFQSIGQGLADQRWSAAQLEDLQTHLQNADFLNSSVQSIYGERDIAALPGMEGTMPWLVHGWGLMEEVNMARGIKEYILPRIDIANRVISPSLNRALQQATHLAFPASWFKGMFHHNILVSMTLPAYETAPLKIARAQAGVDLAAIACALERYHLASGQYPDDLVALTPKYLTTLPHDVINGQPLHYRRTDNGRYVLYSVGWNEKDDGGKVGVTSGATPHSDPNSGDWVWEYPGQ